MSRCLRKSSAFRATRALTRGGRERFHRRRVRTSRSRAAAAPDRASPRAADRPGLARGARPARREGGCGSPLPRTAHRASANDRPRRQVAAPRLPWRRRHRQRSALNARLRVGELTGVEMRRGDLIIAVGSRDREERPRRAQPELRQAGSPVCRSSKTPSSWARTQSRNRGSVAPERRSPRLERLRRREQGRVAAVHDVAVCRKESRPATTVRRWDLGERAPARVGHVSAARCRAQCH